MLEARAIAARHLQRVHAQRFGDDIVILDEWTVVKPRGWVFGYQHRRFLLTRKMRDALIGNGPIFVDKDNGKIVQFRSARSVDHYYALYESGKTREDRDGVLHLPVRHGDE